MQRVTDPDRNLVESLATDAANSLDYGAATDVGLHRELNEDVMLARPPLFLVADGMGGHAGGEVAAELARRTFLPLVNQPAVGREDILAAIDAANTAILDAMLDDSELVGMGTTLAGLYYGHFAGTAHWFVFNVGDSRVYRLLEGLLEQLTVDHSEVEELVAAGRITTEEARTYPGRHIITRSLGMRPPPAADLWVLPAEDSATYLVCSDGLTSEVADTDIQKALADALSAQAAADTLCRLALEAGGHDNVSVVVVRVHAGQQPHADVATGPRANLVG